MSGGRGRLFGSEARRGRAVDHALGPTMKLWREQTRAGTLTRGKPQVSQSAQVTARTVGFGEGGFGEGRFGGVLQVVVDIVPSDVRCVETVVDGALAFLEREMTGLGII